MSEKFKMRLVIGDWSKDGHNQSEEVELLSNKSVEDVREAYKAAVKLTGVAFHHSNGQKDIPNVPGDLQIATEYEDGIIHLKVYKKLLPFGLDKLIKETDEFETDGAEDPVVFLNTDNFTTLWIWFVKLADPTLEIEETNFKKSPAINGWWGPMNVGFGYGLFI